MAIVNGVTAHRAPWAVTPIDATFCNGGRREPLLSFDSFPPNPMTTQSGEDSGKKGCLLGCLGVVIVGPILVFIIGYIVVLHTSIPLQLVAKALEEDENISIEGFGGSISRGFTIDSFHYRDDFGNQSHFEGLALKWADINRMLRHGELVIEEISLRRAHLYIDPSDDIEADPIEEDRDDFELGERTDESLKLFAINKVDVRQVVIESSTGDFKLELEAFLMEGLRIEGDDFNLSSLTVDSNLVDLEVEDAETISIAGKVIPFQRRITGVLKPEMHQGLIKPIDFAIDLGALGGGSDLPCGRPRRLRGGR